MTKLLKQVFNNDARILYLTCTVQPKTVKVASWNYSENKHVLGLWLECDGIPVAVTITNMSFKPNEVIVKNIAWKESINVCVVSFDFIKEPIAIIKPVVNKEEIIDNENIKENTVYNIPEIKDDELIENVDKEVEANYDPIVSEFIEKKEIMDEKQLKHWLKDLHWKKLEKICLYFNFDKWEGKDKAIKQLLSVEAFNK